MDLQVRSQKLSACWRGASARRLDGHKNRIQACQRLGIVAPEHPPLVTVILVEQAETHWSGPIARASPNLERNVLPVPNLAVKIEPIKDQGSISGIENAPELPGGPAVLIRVENIGNIEAPGAD